MLPEYCMNVYFWAFFSPEKISIKTAISDRGDMDEEIRMRRSFLHLVLTFCWWIRDKRICTSRNHICIAGPQYILFTLFCYFSATVAHTEQVWICKATLMDFLRNSWQQAINMDAPVLTIRNKEGRTPVALSTPSAEHLLLPLSKASYNWPSCTSCSLLTAHRVNKPQTFHTLSISICTTIL